MPTRLRLLTLLAAGALVIPACSNDDGEKKDAIDTRLRTLAGAGVYVGGVAYTNTLVAIHFDGAGKPSPGMRTLVTDGVPGGNAEWFEGKANGASFKFTSASGKATIEGKIDMFETEGTVTFADIPAPQDWFFKTGLRRRIRFRIFKSWAITIGPCLIHYLDHTRSCAAICSDDIDSRSSL